ncbi:spore germination protein (amino acid permease) [Paenibacillus algorifonticola]|uniref:Spore germination protein (Amino acid permease) n=1 Tax=Paenibacillus algorifonticola TaxID=684063 RepID=A0A1I1Z477_9BACL|nr:endospore germination permease [Paenibacillus algorifonticola]SFE25273.1 spore germination protein (amino acid permease) [Paenibacillus algorifonticola]
MKKSLISASQFFFIIFVSITSLTFFSVPSQLIAKVKQDLWLSMALGAIIDIYVAVLLYRLGRMYAGQSLIQYTRSILGKAGKVVGLIFLLFFLCVMVTAMWIYSDFLSRTLMPETPRLVFSISMTICAGLAAVKGIEAIARLSQIIGFIILLTSVVLFTSSIPYIQLQFLLPPFENGMLPAIQGAIYPGSWFGICIMMGMLMPHIKKQSGILKMKVYAVVLGTSVMTLYLLYSIVVMGPVMAGHFENPIYILSRITQFLIFERIEVLLLLIFISGSFITISTLYYAVTEGTAQWLGTKSHKPWVYVFGIIFILSPMFPYSNESYMVDRYLSYWFPLVSLIIEGGFMTFLFIWAVVKSKVSRSSS